MMGVMERTTQDMTNLVVRQTHAMIATELVSIALVDARRLLSPPYPPSRLQSLSIPHAQLSSEQMQPRFGICPSKGKLKRGLLAAHDQPRRSPVKVAGCPLVMRDRRSRITIVELILITSRLGQAPHRQGRDQRDWIGLGHLQETRGKEIAHQLICNMVAWNKSLTQPHPPQARRLTKHLPDHAGEVQPQVLAVVVNPWHRSILRLYHLQTPSQLVHRACMDALHPIMSQPLLPFLRVRQHQQRTRPESIHHA